jgi:hypothetical protein
MKTWEYMKEKKAMVIWCDNQGVISLTKNPMQDAQTKHIDVQHHFVQEWVENGEVTFEYCIKKNLKISKKWNTQGSWNGTIVLTNKKITKVVCFQMMQSQNYGLQQLTKFESSMCTQKHGRKEWKTTQNHTII